MESETFKGKAVSVTVVSNLEEVTDGIRKRLERNAEVVGMYLSGQVVRKINKSGMRMRRATKASRKRGRTRSRRGATPATPGDPPRVITGRLKGSIRHAVLASAFDPSIRVTIGAHTEYARRLELGWPKGQHTHPYLRPTIDENRKEIVRRFTRGLV